MNYYKNIYRPGCFALMLFFFIACGEKKNENCSNPDAVNYDPDGESESLCTYPSDGIKGAYGMTLVEYPLQPTHEGETYSFDIRDAYCSGPERSYRYVQFFSLQSPFSPSDFCLLLDGYQFEFTDAMNITFATAHVTGTGSFSPDGNFEFTGTIHQQNGSEHLIRLSGGK